MLSKYAKVLLLTPTTGSLVVCSLGLVAGTVFLSRLTGTKNHKQTHTQAPIAQHAVEAPVGPSARVHPAPSAVPMKLVSQMATPAQKQTRTNVATVAFSSPIAANERERLRHFEGMPVKDVIRSEKFRAFVDEVVPYAPFHYGIDVPLTQALESILAASSEPVVIRDDRYMLLSTSTGTPARRALIWVDLQEGIAVSGIYFRPSNGEPTPTLTLFSKQVTSNSVRVTQLPLAFMKDLQQWSVTANVQTVATRYFVNASNRKSVLNHEENYCASSWAEALPPHVNCKNMNDVAADIDMAAVTFMGQTHFASNATMRTVADSEAAR